MNKTPLNRKILQKTIQTTQAIEGYDLPDRQTQQKIQKLKEQYGIKVSVQK